MDTSTSISRRRRFLAYQDAVLQGEVVTRWLLGERGKRPRWFRHPFTHTGPTREARAAFEVFLAERGYAVAPFTVENSDYVFASLLASSIEAGDLERAARLRDAYLEHTDAVIAFFEEEALSLFQREIPQVLLLHANPLNAEVLPDLLSRLKARGYRFVTLDRALADPAFARDDAFVGPQGPSWIHCWRSARGQDPGEAIRREPDPPPWVFEAFRSR